jgi:hypothetical protein
MAELGARLLVLLEFLASRLLDFLKNLHAIVETDIGSMS